MQRRSLVARVLGVLVVVLATTAAGDSIASDLTDASDFRVRVQAALRIGKQGGPAARAELEKGLTDSHPAVRASCAVALGNMGDAAAAPAIERAMRAESSPAVKTAMKESVDKLRASGGKPGDASSGGIESAKYVVQLGTMRNNTGVRVGDLETAMQQAARNKARSIKGAVVVDPTDASTMRRASERRIPVLLVDGSLTRLTQTTGRDGGVIITAQVDLSVRKVPQQTLKGTVSGNASASDDKSASGKAILELQNRAVGGAVESAVSSVGSEIAALAN